MYITDHGTPAHVLLTFDEYQRLVGSGASIVDLLILPVGTADVDPGTPRPRDLPRPADLA